MPRITRLVQGKKNPNRVNLYLDDHFAFVLSLDEVVKHGLKKGLEVSQAQLTELKEGDATQYLYAKILNFISYRPRSVQEVRDRLYHYDLKEKSKQNILIERLQSRGYLDDLAFARWFTLSRNAHRPRSSRLLAQELKAKGVSEEIIKSLSSLVIDEGQTITTILNKKLGAPRVLEPNQRQKIFTFLSRQGFPWDKIKEVVKKWESE